MSSERFDTKAGRRSRKISRVSFQFIIVVKSIKINLNQQSIIFFLIEFVN